MTVYDPHAERLAKSAVGPSGAVDHRRHLGCEILSWLPLLRATARVRCASPAAADALATATLRQALATTADSVPFGDLRPWLLGLQRTLHAQTLAAATREPAPTPIDHPPARGAAATWQRLQWALARLPDHQREALILADGAYFTQSELALSLGCSAREASRRVRHARAALLARLEAARLAPLPAARPARPRRPLRQPLDRPRPCARERRSRGSTQAYQVWVAEQQDRQTFARRLNVALFWALWRDADEPETRRSLKQLIAEDAPPSGGFAAAAAGGSSTLGRAGRTSWLRLMFIAYACADQGIARS